METNEHLTEDELKVLEERQSHDTPGPQVIQRLVAEVRLCWKEMADLKSTLEHIEKYD